MTPSTPFLHRENRPCSPLAATPPEARLTPDNASGAFLQKQIDRLQARCDAMRGQDGKPSKAGYRQMLARLTDAKTAALVSGVRNGS